MCAAIIQQSSHEVTYRLGKTFYKLVTIGGGGSTGKLKCGTVKPTGLNSGLSPILDSVLASISVQSFHPTTEYTTMSLTECRLQSIFSSSLSKYKCQVFIYIYILNDPGILVPKKQLRILVLIHSWVGEIV